MAEFLGQLLIVGLEESRWTSSCERWLRRIQPGGVLLTEHNFRTPERTAEMLRKIAGALDVPPFLALEEDGGSVDPLRRFFPRLPSPHLAAVKGLPVVGRLGSLIGEACALLGFNLDLAPRLDLANPEVKLSLQPQYFHADPRRVAKSGESFVNGLRGHKVLACGKYFPGLGAEEYMETSPLPIVDKPMATLWRQELLPYRQLLPKLALVNLSCVGYKAYDFDVAVPACLSDNVLQGLLRSKLGFGGIALFDPFAVAFAGRPRGTGTQSFGVSPDAFAKSISAGCDMCSLGWFTKFATHIAATLTVAIENGALGKARADEALKRVARAKRRLRVPPAEFSGKAYEQLCRRFEDFRKDVQSMERANA